MAPVAGPGSGGSGVSPAAPVARVLSRGRRATRRSPGGLRSPVGPRGRRDAGSATLETVIVFPIVMVLIWGLLQLGLWMHGRNVCQGAAEEAARAGAALGASSATAFSAGTAFADQAGHGLLRDTSVTVDRSGDRVTVTVEADVLTVAPFFPSHISQTATLPVERRT